MRLPAILLATISALGPAVALAADPQPAPVAAQTNPAVPVIVEVPPAKDPDLIDGRKRPGQQPTYPDTVLQTNPGAVYAPAPDAFPTDQIPVPDRWRLSSALGLTHPHTLDPYNENVFKGDRPLKGTTDWFLELNGISDTVVQPQSAPTPIRRNNVAPSASAASRWRAVR